jgi:hypothetical protein
MLKVFDMSIVKNHRYKIMTLNGFENFHGIKLVKKNEYLKITTNKDSI